MIIGTSSLIPNGILFNNKQDKYPVYLKKGRLFGGIPGTINEMAPLDVSLQKKI